MQPKNRFDRSRGTTSKRILNLNDFAVPAFKVIGTLLVIVPGGLWLLHAGLGALGMFVPALLVIARIALALGGTGLLIMLVLILLEQVQDKQLIRRYDKSLRKRIPGRDGLAECPACGYRGLRAFERNCPACGKELE